MNTTAEMQIRSSAGRIRPGYPGRSSSPRSSASPCRGARPPTRRSENCTPHARSRRPGQGGATSHPRPFSAGQARRGGQPYAGLGMPPAQIRAFTRIYSNPASRLSPRQLRDFNLYATPEQKDRMQRARQHSPHYGNPQPLEFRPCPRRGLECLDGDSAIVGDPS